MKKTKELVICTKDVVYIGDGGLMLQRGRFYNLERWIGSDSFYWSDQNDPPECPAGQFSSCWFPHPELSELYPNDINSEDVKDFYLSIEDWREQQIDKIIFN